jgi:two-component system chemotaxis response regulator CheB
MSSVNGRKIKVMIVDDSLMMQRFIKQLVLDCDDIEVVAVASDPYEARDLIKVLQPDVLILDIEMPRMNGLTFLANLMRLRPMPVLMNSSLSQRGAYETIKALELGAVDYIGKPQSAELVPEYKVELIRKLNAISLIKMNKRTDPVSYPPAECSVPVAPNNSPVVELIALGASTGGIEALTVVLKEIPAQSPPILVVQHIPQHFSQAFADRLNELCKVNVCEAKNGQKIENNSVYIAPGGLQMALVQKGKEYFIHIHDGPLVSGHKPSVDELFCSIATSRVGKCKAALLTGMGSDGAIGLKALYYKGAKTVVQDKNTSIVWGMPSSALELESKHQSLPITSITHFLLS